MMIITTVRKHLKKVAKNIAFIINSLSVAAASLQVSGVLALQSPMLQLKAMLGIVALNMFAHHLKHPADVAKAEADKMCCKK